MRVIGAGQVVELPFFPCAIAHYCHHSLFAPLACTSARRPSDDPARLCRTAPSDGATSGEKEKVTPPEQARTVFFSTHNKQAGDTLTDAIGPRTKRLATKLIL
nr:hypothetical protein [Pandoravirus aubagnensis]